MTENCEWSQKTRDDIAKPSTSIRETGFPQKSGDKFDQYRELAECQVIRLDIALMPTVQVQKDICSRARWLLAL